MRYGAGSAFNFTNVSCDDDRFNYYTNNERGVVNAREPRHELDARACGALGGAVAVAADALMAPRARPRPVMS